MSGPFIRLPRAHSPRVEAIINAAAIAVVMECPETPGHTRIFFQPFGDGGGCMDVAVPSSEVYAALLLGEITLEAAEQADPAPKAHADARGWELTPEHPENLRLPSGES